MNRRFWKEVFSLTAAHEWPAALLLLLAFLAMLRMIL